MLGGGGAPAGCVGATRLWLGFRVLLANLAEGLAEGRSKAQAAALRGANQGVIARKLREPRFGADWESVPGTTLRRGDVVLVEAGDMIPVDGAVSAGAASVNDTDITADAAPLPRESAAAVSAAPGGPPLRPAWVMSPVPHTPLKHT